MAESPRYRELLQLLNEFDVEYLTVGGFAVMKYGEPRYTKDLDVWVHNSPQNSLRVVGALTKTHRNESWIRISWLRNSSPKLFRPDPAGDRLPSAAQQNPRLTRLFVNRPLANNALALPGRFFRIEPSHISIRRNI